MSGQNTQNSKQNSNVNKVTVLGAGVLGAQIAFQAAYAGFDVISYDVDEEALAKASQRFDKLFVLYQQQMTEADEQRLNDTRQRLQQSAQLAEAVQHADLIIEAIPENLALKQSVWATVGQHAPDHAIFTTNTSTLLPSLFADSCGDSSRFLALHFANDIWKIRVVEVMGTSQTTQQAVDTTMAFANEMGMIPVQIHKEQRGYIMNSLLVPFLDAACRLYADEVAEPADVDKVWKLATGAPQGPFEIMDLIGLRTVYAVHANKAEKTGDPITQKFVDVLKTQFLAQGKNGKESGSGFYQYDEQGKIISS